MSDEIVVPIPLPEAEVVYLNKAEVSEARDPFAQKAEIVKSYAGTTSNFKRKVSNELRKYNRSADGQVESKQLSEKGGIYDGYDVFGVVQPPHNLDMLVKLYETSTAHYAAVNAKVSNIVGLGYRLVETPATKRAIEDINDEKKLNKFRSRLNAAREELLGNIEDFNEEDGFVEVLIRVWRDYEIMGNGYLEVGRRRDGTIGYVGHIPAQTIRVRRDGDGFVQISGNRAQFFRNFGDKRTNPIGGDSEPNEIIHFKKYSPSSTHYGIPDIIAAAGAVAGIEYANRFNLDYFENKAVPRHVITLKGANLPKTAQMDLLQFFETGLKGQNHRSLFIPLPADGPNGEKVELNIDAVEAGTQDSSFINYLKQSKQDIFMAHRVPITKVSVAEGMNLALAKDADKTFKEQVCGPEQDMAQKKINRIVKEMTDAFEFKLNEMTLTDEDTQSKIDDRDRKAGLKTANEVRASRGMPSIDGGDELFDLNGKAKTDNSTQTEQTANRQRDTTRTASATDSNGTARNPKGEGRTDGTA